MLTVSKIIICEPVILIIFISVSDPGKYCHMKCHMVFTTCTGYPVHHYPNILDQEEKWLLKKDMPVLCSIIRKFSRKKRFGFFTVWYPENRHLHFICMKNSICIGFNLHGH